MPKKIIISIIVIIVIIIAAGALVFFNQEEEKDQEEEKGFYTKHYNIDLIDIESIEGITPEIAKEYKDKFVEYQDKLEEAVKNYEQGGKKEEEKPNPDFFVEKARYANYLGQTDWAIEILNNLFDYYENSSVGWNNLAKLYEKKKDYIKANEYYLKMIDTFGERQFWGQYHYIAKNYMTIGDKEKVREYYERHKSFGGYDGEIEEYLAK